MPLLLTVLAMIAFAANSLLCRMALAGGASDPASFSLIRFAAGATVLTALSLARGRRPGGSWAAALVLLIYAAGFSVAYVALPTGTGALILFAAVQLTMIAYGLWRGERLRPWQWLGLAVALGGLVALVAPGLAAPAPLPSLLMAAAGIAWGGYSLLGRRANDPIAANAGNFLRFLLPAALLALPLHGGMHVDGPGWWAALLSGALASGGGYAVWYRVLPTLPASTAATVQLSVPALAAVAGVLVLDEPVTLRLVGASVTILGGIALVLLGRRRPA